MVPTSRCTIYRGTFIGACLFSEFRNTSGNGVPSPWITDSGERTRHQRNLYRNRRVGKRGESVDEVERGGGGRETKRATAITVDGQKKKNDSCINGNTHVYLRVVSATLRLSSCAMMDGYHVRQRSSFSFAPVFVLP